MTIDWGELTSLLREHASKWSIPGAVVGVLRDGEVATVSYGVRSLATGEPVTSATRFSAGSLTKSMVATVVAGLAEENRLSIDDPIAAHVPEVRACGWAEGATLRDLLANRSGLPLRSGLEFGFDERSGGDDAALSRLAGDVAAAEPSPGFWSYANVGWCLLGRAVETATGMSWEDAMQRRLAGPAGLRETTFTSGGAVPQRVSGHEDGPDGPVPVAPLVARAYGPAGTTVTTTAADLLRFAALHLDDPSLAALRDVHADVAIHSWLDSWCLGWAHFDWDGAPVWGWDGLIDGERSVLRIVPDHDAAVVLLTNGSAGRALYRSLFPELMGSLFGVGVPPLRLEPSQDAAGDLSRYEGVYAWPDRRVEVTASGTALRITTEAGERDALPIDERTFLVDAEDPDNPTVTFGGFDAAGRPHVLYVMLWGLPRQDA